MGLSTSNWISIVEGGNFQYFQTYIQKNSTYPDAGYPARQLPASAWPFG